MALSVGTNCGFVSTAPTADPTGGITGAVDAAAFFAKFTSPSDAVKITSIGWWCDTATEESNFEVGLYAADGAVVPGEAGTRLQINATNAKGTGSGWKRVTGIDWTISGSTIYWLAFQLDNTATPTIGDFETIAGTAVDELGTTALSDPAGGGAISNNGRTVALYAVYGTATNIKTYNTNPKANVKSIDTNLIANVKTLNTNA
jgi:hypothetical protein